MGRSRASLDAVGLTLGHRLGDIVICDVTDSVAVASAVAAIPTVDVLVNNAGQAESAPLTRPSDELWARMLAVTRTGAFHMPSTIHI